MKILHLVCLTLLLLVSRAVGEEEKVWWDGEDVERKLDVSQARSQAPSRTPSSKPSRRPSAAPSVSSQPSRSMQPTYPVMECSQDHATFPFCYNGQGGGRFGYAACLVMNSTANCGRYDFQILGTNYSTDKPINFTKCANVWTWFTRCIAASFPTCRRGYEGIFRGYTYSSFTKSKKVTTIKTGTTSKTITEWEVAIEGSVNCTGNCNEGYNRWICSDIDEADGMIAFARWVAGVRPKPQSSAYSLFREPETNCQTEAPSQSAAPTRSPAPTIASAPLCSELGKPAHVTTSSSVMSNNTFPGGRSYFVAKDCTYVIVAAGPYPNERFDNPLEWLLRSAALAGATVVPSSGKFTGQPVSSSLWVLNDKVEPYSVTLAANPGLTANLTFVFPMTVGTSTTRKTAATNFRNFWRDRTWNNPNIWRTNLDNDLRCGSGPFCFDEFPKIRCSVDFESEYCGKLDFLTTTAKGVVDRTNNVYEWFHKCIQTAYVTKGPCTAVLPSKPTPFQFNGLNRWNNVGSDTTQWTATFEGGNKSDGRIEYKCPKGAAGKEMQADMLKFYNLIANAGYFTMKPAECTKAPTPSPTICAEEDSLLNNPPIYIALVVDVSYSTYRDSFGGISVGDQNWDLKANTISDAAIAASKALLSTILEMDNLDNTNTNIGLILFDTVATYVGNFPPLNADNTAINPVLLSTLEGIKIATSEQQVLDSNKGWTNIDDGLDKAILYFKDTSRPVFSDAFNLMVFLSDGKPTVMGDGDNEPFCTVNRADCSKASADTITKCTTTGSNACSLDPLRFCVLGSGYDTCEDQNATKMYASELAELDSFKVTRVAIGIGPNSDVAPGSALELIDNDPVRISYGLQPRRVMDANGLIAALRDLCPQSTPSPTRTPSAMPSRSPSSTPSAGPTAGPSAGPTAGPSGGPSSGPTAGPTVDICDYQVIDFTTKSGEVLPKSGESLASLEYEEYGMMIEAIPALPSDVPGPAKVGRAYYYDSGDSSAGMVVVVPAYNDTTKISQLGGSIAITLAMVHDKVIKFDLWNTSTGANVETRGIDGEVLATQIIPYTAKPNSTLTEVIVDVVGVQTIVISFVGKGGISTIRACRDPLQTKSPSGWKTPEPTHEPTPGPSAGPTAGPSAGPSVGPTEAPFAIPEEPTAGPTSGPSAGPTEEENTCPEDIQIIPVPSEDVTGLEYPPLKIKSRNLSSVVLSVSKLFSKTVSKVFVEFINGYSRKCLEYDYLEWSTKDEDFTVQCMQQVPVSIVTLYIVDETAGNGNIVIPECCHADPPPGWNVVKYTYKIYCESQCPEDE